MIQCSTCQQYFHGDCITCLSKPLLFGDIFGQFTCSTCNSTETFERKNLSWIIIVHLVIYNLVHSAKLEDNKKTTKREHYYFRWKEDICAFIDDYWDYLLPGKQRSATWNNTIASVLSTHSGIFLSGFEKFKQSAWWTLHKIEPPTGEKKKAASKVKPNLKKPLKRNKKEQPPRKTRKLENEAKEKHDMLCMSSLSELSSDEEDFSDHVEETSKAAKSSLEPKHEQIKIEKIQETINEEIQENVTKEREKKEAEKQERDKKEEERKNAEHKEAELKATEEKKEMEAAKKEAEQREAKQKKKAEAEKKAEELKKEKKAVTLQSPQDEWLLLQKLEHTSKSLVCSAKRYKRKLAVRRLKRSLGIKLFDIDYQITQSLRSTHNMEPIATETTIIPTSNQKEKTEPEVLRPNQINFTPYVCSFASRLMGTLRQRQTLTRDESWLSSWNGRKLRPFIRRDFESKPDWMLVMAAIKECAGTPKKNVVADAKKESIDYVYFQREHLHQANQLLSRSFWEGIDVSESLLFPEYSIVALYKRRIIGCAFMTPEAYVTYIAVDPGWGNAGIGQFMLYHLFQTAISKDVTLHVSANNNAMLLYQKFGFKPEEFVVNFYDKYLPSNSSYSKNAFYLRLRR
ncbi:hypothetical protein BY458DRAFT_567682 [Sporodiniella umbellata]|nr:hypothetical protein BY458DRAFT_567682 [Sporodiniella umbellata]